MTRDLTARSKYFTCKDAVGEAQKLALILFR